MDADVQRIVRECTKASDEERIAFPEVVAKLVAAGVERYHADLTRAEKTYYLPSGESETVGTAHSETGFSQDFAASEVESAIRAIQAQRIGYKEFCRRIGGAGCVGYFVFLTGRRAVYYGRQGESYIEPFAR